MTVETTQIPDIVYAIACSSAFDRDGICFAARYSGLEQSSDGGATWRSAYDSLGIDTPLATLAVALSPDFEADHSVFAGVAGGILRSFDGGDSWYSNVLPGSPVISALAVSPNFAHDGVLFAGTMEDGLLRSADRGSQWSPWNFGLLDLGVICLAVSPDFADDETLCVGTSTGIFRSTNGGRAWREINLPLDYEPVLSLALSPAYAVDGTLFAGTEAHGLWTSVDRGRNWTQVGANAIAGPVNNILLSPTFPQAPELLINLATEVLVSRDGGQTWSEPTALPAPDTEVSSVAAPRGLGANMPLLVGLVEGGVLRLELR